MYCSCFLQVKDAILGKCNTYDSILKYTLLSRIELNSVLNEMSDQGFLNTSMQYDNNDYLVVYTLAGTHN